MASQEVAERTRPARLWRNHDWVLLWGGQLVSVVGTQVSQLAYPLLMLALTRSPAQAGFLTAARTEPFLLLGLPAGALVDRWDRRWLMIVCDAGRALALGSIPLAMALGRLTLAQRMGASSAIIGLVLGAGGLGSIAGAILSGVAIRRLTFGRIALGVHLMWAVLLPLYVLVPNPLALAVITAAAYGITPVYFVAQYSYRLSLVPEGLQGRVNGVFRLLMFAGKPLGLSLAGLLSQSVGPIRAMLVFAALIVLLALAVTLNPELRSAGKLAEVSTAA